MPITWILGRDKRFSSAIRGIHEQIPEQSERAGAVIFFLWANGFLALSRRKAAALIWLSTSVGLIIKLIDLPREFLTKMHFAVAPILVTLLIDLSLNLELTLHQWLSIPIITLILGIFVTQTSWRAGLSSTFQISSVSASLPDYG